MMRQSIVLVFALLLSVSAAKAETDSIATTRWSLGGSLGYDFVNYSWKNVAPQWGWYEFDNAFSGSISIQTMFQWKERVALRAGFGLSRKNHSMAFNSGDDGWPIQPSTVQLKYIQVPLRADYTLLEGKISGYASGGILNEVLVQSTTTFDYGDIRNPQTFDTYNDYRSYVPSVSVGLGFRWRSKQGFSLQAEGTFQQPLTPVVNTGAKRWNMVSTSVGAFYHF